MPIQLSPIEARILGALIEKSLTTPDQYPLSLNSLTNACNQKTSREPVMDLAESDVARTLATLQEKNLVGRRSEPGSRVTKFLHHVENLLNGGTSKEVGIICVLLLRGAQTPGEIKGRTDRLCEFTGVAEVEQALQDLMTRPDGPFVERLPRQPGQKEARYRHLFLEPAKPAATPAAKPKAASAPTPATPSAPANGANERLERLETRVKVLEEKVGQLLERLKKLVP